MLSLTDDDVDLTFQETLFMLNVLSSEEVSTAPGERKQPTSMLNGEFWKEISFPYLFPRERIWI